MQPEEGDEISALLAESLEWNSKPAEISPEDAAWVDSCLAFDSQMPEEESWNAMREALLETLNTDIINEDKELTGENCPPVDEFAFGGEITEESSDSFVQEAKIKQDPSVVSLDDIFKVWELETREDEEEEENELVKLLKRALTVSRYQGSSEYVDVDDVQVDELAAGIGDLSLESRFE